MILDTVLEVCSSNNAQRMGWAAIEDRLLLVGMVTGSGSEARSPGDYIHLAWVCDLPSDVFRTFFTRMFICWFSNIETVILVLAGERVQIQLNMILSTVLEVWVSEDLWPLATRVEGPGGRRGKYWRCNPSSMGMSCTV